MFKVLKSPEETLASLSLASHASGMDAQVVFDVLFFPLICVKQTTDRSLPSGKSIRNFLQVTVVLQVTPWIGLPHLFNRYYLLCNNTCMHVYMYVHANNTGYRVVARPPCWWSLLQLHCSMTDANL